MTYDEIVEHAKERGLFFGMTFPTTNRVLFRRIEIRQQEIFSQAARVNPDYFGVSASGPLDAEFRVNLADLDVSVDVDPAANLTRVEIEDGGTHPTLVEGDQVNVVPFTDIEADLAPRMTLRNFILQGVGTDLVGVASVSIFYGYRPENKAQPFDGFENAELPDPYQELLVIDLMKWVLKQTLGMDVEGKATAIAALGEEEAEMSGAFLTEVGDFAGAQVSRFGSVRGSQRD
ncbi:MAG: hypothetical protein KAJ42_11565 [Gemmatimonadetes bacterium]|nr:hypothetical protein [Gemmatimonadota bacterium]